MVIAGAVLVEEAPEFEFAGGLFYARHADGLVRVYRPNTYFKALAAMAGAGKSFKWEGAEIIPFPVPEDRELGAH